MRRAFAMNCGIHGRRERPERAQRGGKLPLAKWPVRRPANWIERVNQSLPRQALDQLRVSVERGRPLGDLDWVQATAKRLNLDFTLRGPGRPKGA